MLRRLYDWCIAAADKPYATWLMGIISFVESSFFPIPPDTMLIPMSLARPDRAWFYATVCTLTSVAGGDPKHREIVEKVGAFAHHGVAIAVHGIDRDLDRLLHQLLGHFAAARAQQPRRPRGCRIGSPSGHDGLVKTVERITHSDQNNAVPTGNVLTNNG